MTVIAYLHGYHASSNGARGSEHLIGDEVAGWRWTLIDIVVDKGRRSRESLRRPKLERTIDRVCSGEADVLVVINLLDLGMGESGEDRMTRIFEAGATLWVLNSRQGWTSWEPNLEWKVSVASCVARNSRDRLPWNR